jgi:hypothetical protein
MEDDKVLSAVGEIAQAAQSALSALLLSYSTDVAHPDKKVFCGDFVATFAEIAGPDLARPVRIEDVEQFAHHAATMVLMDTRLRLTLECIIRCGLYRYMNDP